MVAVVREVMAQVAFFHTYLFLSKISEEGGDATEIVILMSTEEVDMDDFSLSFHVLSFLYYPNNCYLEGLTLLYLLC